MTHALGIALTLLLCAATVPAAAAAPSKCAPGDVVLWGDGEHDDTAGLNAWFRGETVVWARTGEPVGATIVDQSFKLSEAIYVHAGTDRTLVRFRFVWPERGEVVSADSLSTGTDPDRQPVAANLHIVGGDPDEGVAFDAPTPPPHNHDNPNRCLTS
jgi:hypothetical protein